MELLSDCSEKERRLIDGCRKSEPRSQELFFKHFYGFAMGICLRYTFSRNKAQEILNDSFLKVFSTIGSCPDIRQFKGWFRRIIVNTALDHYRKESVWKRYREMEEQESWIDIAPDIVDSMTAEEILQILDRLPALWKLVFNLYEIEGYVHEEIGKMLSISPASSRSYLTRAKKRLRSLISQEFS